MSRRIIKGWLPLLIAAALFFIGYGIGFLIVKVKESREGLFKLTICETSDVHGAYFDSLYDGRARKTSLANVSSYMNQLRADGRQVVFIDNGDNLQGDVAAYYFDYMDKGEKHLYPRMAEYLDYDAVVLGNHDIETGHPVYDAIVRSTKIPYLAANAVRDSGENAGKPYFKPYTILKRKGLRIAVIGMTNANEKEWVREEKWKGMDFQIISDIAQKQVDEVIEKEHPHLVILSVHSGTAAGPQEEAGPDRESEALYLARTLEGVDVVLCGHDHRPFETLVDRGGDSTVAILNPGARAAYVAQCDVQIVIRKGKAVAKCFENKLVRMEEYPVDKEFMATFRKDFEKVREFANTTVGTISEPISLEDALEGPSAYMSFIHSVQMEMSGADISLAAPLANKGEIKAGNVSFQGISDLYRYENTLYTIKLSGRQVKEYLEYSYDNWIGEKGPFFNFDSADGILYEVSVSAPKGERINIRSMSDGTPFSEESSYLVAINSYRMGGGGGHITEGLGMDPADLEIVGIFPDMKELIGDYLARHGVVEPKINGNWAFVK